MAKVSSYEKIYTLKLPSSFSNEYKDDVKQNINKTPKEKQLEAKKAAQQRIGNSVIKATIRTSALQVASNYIASQVNHQINLISLVEGDTYKQQIAQVAQKGSNSLLNAVRAGSSAALISGGNVGVGLAAGAVTLIGSGAKIGIEASIAEQEAVTKRSIDAVNVSQARRALSISSTYGSRNIQNKGVMY